MKKRTFAPPRVAKIVIVAVPILVFFVILNENFSFSGIHKVTVNSFLHLPGSVQYAGGSEIGLISTLKGLVTRPYKDQTQFAVTLPRGFDSMTVRAELEADAFATLSLSAKVPASAASQAESFRLPTAYGTAWQDLPLGAGKLYVKNSSQVKDVGTFWNSFSKLKHVYSIGDGLKGSIPSALYADGVHVSDIQIPSGFRGNFTVSSYFDGTPQQVTFDARVAYSVAKNNTLRFTVERQGAVLATANVADGGKQTQHIVVDVPAGDPGFYTLRFVPSSEGTVVSHLQFRGTAVELGPRLFIDQSATPVTLYARCANATVEAAHQLGVENPFSVNGRLVTLLKVKQAQNVQTKAAVSTYVFPRADVSISNTCGFMLQPDRSLREAYEKLTKRITVVPHLTAATLKTAEYIYDPLSVAKIGNTKQGTYVLEKTFDLHTLAAKGKTFTFTLAEPGLTTQPGAYLHMKSITFTARRPAFAFADIGRALNALLKRK